MKKAKCRLSAVPLFLQFKILGGKWKIEILYYIGFQNIQTVWRTTPTHRRYNRILLTKQLRELEAADGFISRFDYKEVPPRVEYSLTELGKKFYACLRILW